MATQYQLPFKVCLLIVSSTPVLRGIRRDVRSVDPNTTLTRFSSVSGSQSAEIRLYHRRQMGRRKERQAL